MKTVKNILKAVVALVLVLLALLLAHPLWIGPVVRTAVRQLAPKFLGVPATLDGFSLNGYTGRVTLDGLAIDNPPGCREDKFVKVGHLCVDVNPLSLASDAIVVEEISLADLYVSIMADDRKVYNFDTIARASASADRNAKRDGRKPEEPKAPKEKADGPKVVIDLLQVQNALVQWERVPLPLPSFRLTGIGRAAGGVTFEAAWTETEKRFIAALGPLAQGLQAALDGAGGSIDKGMAAVSEATKSLDDTKKALDDVSKAMKDGSSSSADAAQKSIDAAAKSVKGTVETFKSLFK